MKRLCAAALVAILALCWAVDAPARFPRGAPVSASEPVDMGGGPNLLERSLFSSGTPMLPYASWYVPGNGSPAISTSDYYLINGLYWSRPYDLDTMGAEGAAIKAREGMRFVWMMAPDHPLGLNFVGSGDFYVGYSNDPQIWPDPTTIRVIRYQEAAINVVDQNGYTQNSFLAYQTPWLVYNPDSAGDKFYIYAEGLSVSNARQHELTLFTTSDFLSSTLVGPTIPTTAFSGWTSFGRVTRLGVNNWEAYAFGKIDGSATSVVFYKYASTDGWVWTPDYSTILAGSGPFLNISGQDYMLTVERSAVKDYLALAAVAPNKVYTGPNTRISTAFGPSSGGSTVYPGPTYAQDTGLYEEDGVASIYVSRGFFPANSNYQLNPGPFLDKQTYVDVVGSITSNVMNVTSVPPGVTLAVGYQLNNLSGKPGITSFGTGSGGVGTYNVSATSDLPPGTTITVTQNGGLWQQFIDQYFLITDAAAAASAAPLGVKASCAAGLATVQWNNSLPHQNYRVYQGSSAGSQPTLVGNVTGTSTTFTPPANQQTWIKVVTMNVTEQKSRVVNVYCSAQNAQVNKHVNRVMNDGGSGIDISFVAAADAWLTSNDSYRYLNWWTDVRFGYKLNGSGFIAKIYDLGTTWLPRGGDYTPTTSNTFPSTSSNTSYSANSFRGTTPSWINNASSAHGYFGNGRVNNIQRWNEITLLAAYQRPSGTGAATLFGTGQFASGMFLTQDSGSSGNISFSMYATNSPPSAGPITATVPFASATTPKVVAAVLDSAPNMIVYLDGVAGTPVSAAAYANPTMLNDTVLRGLYRGLISSVVLASGGRGLQTGAGTYSIGNEALFTGAGLAGFSKGLPQPQIQSWGNTFYN